MSSHIATVDFTSYAESVPAALNRIGARKVLAEQERIVVKPNLVNASPHPVTTHVDCCAAVLEYVRDCTKAEVIVAEGTGEMGMDTDELFVNLGYTDLCKRYGVKLLDLNYLGLRTVSDPANTVFPEMYLPEIAFTHYIISVPVLKAHSLAAITGTLKNMMGFAPPEHYGGFYGGWKKARFHGNMQGSLQDLNRFIRPQLTVMDASVGLQDFHLGGPTCDPPVEKILVGYDPYEVDQEAARMLGLDPAAIEHINP